MGNCRHLRHNPGVLADNHPVLAIAKRLAGAAFEKFPDHKMV
jgi:hypothetical protein